tara:strand:+ start:106746 stop:106967 length:222 start_codon:yes stop_codon:yes gene_type:complete
MIQMLSKNKFYTESRGNKMTLEKLGDRWLMVTDNAAARAYNFGRPGYKEFDTLLEVEQQYKSWRGIAALVKSI